MPVSVVLIVLAGATLAVGCAGRAEEELGGGQLTSEDAAESSGAAGVDRAGANSQDGEAAPTGAEPSVAVTAERAHAGALQATAPATAPGPPRKILAKKFVANVRSAPSKQASKLGYLRAGAILQAKTEQPIGFDRCRKGWYELETGGFVCSTVDVIAYTGRRPQERLATQPDLDARLPYPYGYCRRSGTPVYKRLPTEEEAAQFEPKPPVAAVAAAADAGVSAASGPVAPASQGGAQERLEPGAEHLEPEVATLESLLGDPASVLLRRMKRGFYVSLDREKRRAARRYWRTQANGFIPYRRIVRVKGSAFEGVQLVPEPADADAGLGVDADAGMEAGAGGAQLEGFLPVAFVMSKRAHRYRLGPRGRLRKRGKPGYHHRFRPVGRVEVRGRAYLVDADGLHYRERDVRRVVRRNPPEGVGPGERWIDVDLGNQTLAAYEGALPVFATLISSGRIKDPDDPLKNFETPVGAYRISSKHLTATMDGDHALDGPYSIEDVPYVMYFHQAYAFHAAFWHNSFGRPRSHGCINLAPADARFLFRFARPELPFPWHGAYPTDETVRTRVFIHGETPKG